MASTPEKRVKDAVVKILDEYGAYYFFPATHGYGRSGVPDIVVAYKGKFIAIECKAKQGTITALQERELERIRTKGGGIAFYVRGVDEAVGAVKAALDIIK